MTEWEGASLQKNVCATSGQSGRLSLRGAFVGRCLGAAVMNGLNLLSGGSSKAPTPTSYICRGGVSLAKSVQTEIRPLRRLRRQLSQRASLLVVLCKPLTPGEVALRSNDGEGFAETRWHCEAMTERVSWRGLFRSSVSPMSPLTAIAELPHRWSLT